MIDFNSRPGPRLGLISCWDSGPVGSIWDDKSTDYLGCPSRPGAGTRSAGPIRAGYRWQRRREACTLG
ncbi:hypothetical protein BTZ20_0802 [Rhodococcus sp. MTM3W5.2]|nr:hypothetical protein BTZ20_0802 [Rhodococcus sp. MTM3W5.2]